MDHSTRFIFRDKLFETRFFLSFDEKPLLIFCLLYDEALLKEFGDEVNIKTDGNNLMLSKNDWQELVELKTALFYAIRSLPHFKETLATNKIIADDNMEDDFPF